MHVFNGHKQFRSDSSTTVVGIGIFDGFHRGHQALAQRVCALANNDTTSVLYTFDPHPAQVLSPAKAPTLLEPVHQRLEHMRRAGIENVVVETFDTNFAKLSADDFVKNILHTCLRAKHVVVGEDFTFGRDRQGNTQRLHSLAEQFHYQCHFIPPVLWQQNRISSTRIRGLLAAGDVRSAAHCLGRYFEFQGVVAAGAQRGQKLGFPTANLAVGNTVVPKAGVYAVWAELPDQKKIAGVTNIGIAPTFGTQTPKIETHFFDFVSRPLYNSPLRLYFVDRLRDEQKFASLDTLVEQIRKDIEQAKILLSSTNPPS